MTVDFKLLTDTAKLPQQATSGSSGYDLHSTEDVIIPVGKIKLVKTGLSCSIPKGYELQIRSRSGLALKHGVAVFNGVGTVDMDYRGEIGVILANFGENDFEIKIGDRIAQAVFAKVEHPKFNVVENLDITSRDSGGFGSTGKKEINTNGDVPYSC